MTQAKSESEKLDISDSEDNEFSYTCGDCQDYGSVCTNKMGISKTDPASKCKTFKLNKSGVEKTKKEMGKAKRSAPKKIRISDLCSKHVGKVVEIGVQIVGQKDQKALPKDTLFYCGRTGCDVAYDVNILTDKIPTERNCIEKMIFESVDNSLKELAVWYIEQKICIRGHKNKKTHDPLTNIKNHMDYAILHVRDILGDIDKFDDTIYKDRLIYLINQKIPKAKMVKIKGYVVINPHSRDITIIADNIESLESEVSKFSITEDDKENFPKYFNNLETVAQQISPDTVGEKRNIAKKAITLLLHSPHTIPDINGNHIRGGLRIVFIGDTKCDKSRMGGDISGANPTAYRFGEFFIGETGGRTGLTYTIDNENKLLIWGMIPLNDKGLVVIDGMASISGNEFKQFREALEIQKVIVRRSQSGEAMARTRLIGCMNPNKPMNQYPFPCMAIPDNFIFKEPPDISRWELIIPFAIEDVSQSEIMERKPSERPIPDDIFKRHIQWAWSREPEHIVYEDEAKKQIVANSIEIVKDYSISSLPIVHNGFRNILTALSVAYACAEHSTNDTHENIIVKPCHVKKASEFYIEVLEALGLKDYKLHEEGELNINDSEIIQIHQELGEIEYGILQAISFGSKSSTDLADNFDLSVRSIKEHYKLLKKFRLIKTITGKGIELTAKGVKFIRDAQKDSAMVKQSFTNSDKNDKMVKENCTIAPLKNAPPYKKDNKDTVKSAVKPTSKKDSEVETVNNIPGDPPKNEPQTDPQIPQVEGVALVMKYIKEGTINKYLPDTPWMQVAVEHLLKDGKIYWHEGKLKITGGA